MNTKTFITLLQQPELLKSEQLFEIEKIIEAYPFFQAPKALHLKGLKNQESYRYNTTLKHTAAYTTDRHVLFDFITSEVFKKLEEPITSKAVEEKKLEDIEVLASQELRPMPSVPMDTAVTMKLQEADEVLDPKLFMTTDQKVVEAEQPEEAMSPEAILKPDRPFEFDQNERHSFSEWLKISALNPIQRDEVVPEEVTETFEIFEEVQDKDQEAIAIKEEGLKREDKFRLIDNFIAKNPKIGPVSGDTSLANFAKQQNSTPDTLMTETLAKVYVAQKNYKKAIQAYNILILKNPEKSGFFADQIRAIKKLQDRK